MKDRLPYFVVVVIMTVMVWVTFSYHIWTAHRRVIAWDVLSYYAYLPATYIEHDLKLTFLDDHPEKINTQYMPEPDGHGHRVIKTTMGLTYLYAPAFFIANSLAEPFGYEPNGFSEPYVFALVFVIMIYMGIGIFFLAKLLLRYFPPIPVAITLLSVVFGTNLFYYSCFEPAMSHAYNFVLFSIFLYLSPLWLEKPTVWRTIGLGLLSGLIVLIRPTNIIIGLFPLLLGVSSISLLKERFVWLGKHWPMLALAVVAAISVWLPQLAYWKYVTGQWFFYPYGEEGFLWLQPKIIDGLFSYRKGWLLYTPIMFFALAGIPLLFRKYRDMALPVLIFTLLNIYIIFSWWCWWYGGSFGLRALIDSYALLAIPFAATLTWIMSKGVKAIVPLTLVLMVLTSYNLFQTYQKIHDAIHWECMTKEAYWETFLKQWPTETFYEKVKCPWDDDYKRRKGIY